MPNTRITAPSNVKPNSSITAPWNVMPNSSITAPWNVMPNSSITAPWNVMPKQPIAAHQQQVTGTVCPSFQNTTLYTHTTFRTLLLSSSGEHTVTSLTSAHIF
jgi:hypothetical protein